MILYSIHNQVFTSCFVDEVSHYCKHFGPKGFQEAGFPVLHRKHSLHIHLMEGTSHFYSV